MRVSRICSVLLVAMLLGGGIGTVHAQEDIERYFPETGHWVRGVFLEFYEAATEPTLLYGYPITEAFADARTGMRVQYFQRARFESHPDAADGQTVQLTPIGSLLYIPNENPRLDISNALACRYFPATGFPVCFAFLDFFDRNGGVSRFGQPISGFEVYNGRIVQYFERARVEWYPELSGGLRVRPADLGRTYFDAIPEDPVLLEPAVNSFVLQTQVQELLASVFVQKAVAHATDGQQIFVVVRDQTLRPVARASVQLMILWPGGETQTTGLTTDRNGLAAASIAFRDRRPGGARHHQRSGRL